MRITPRLPFRGSRTLWAMPFCLHKWQNHASKASSWLLQESRKHQRKQSRAKLCKRHYRALTGDRPSSGRHLGRRGAFQGRLGGALETTAAHKAAPYRPALSCPPSLHGDDEAVNPSVFLLMTRRPPRSTLFPYTTALPCRGDIVP